MRLGAEVDDPLGAVAEQDPQTWLGGGPFVDDEMRCEGVHADDPTSGLVRHQFRPGRRIGPIVVREALEDAEVDSIAVLTVVGVVVAFVGDHDEPVAPVVDLVVDVVATVAARWSE